MGEGTACSETYILELIEDIWKDQSQEDQKVKNYDDILYFSAFQGSRIFGRKFDYTTVSNTTFPKQTFTCHFRAFP